LYFSNTYNSSFAPDFDFVFYAKLSKSIYNYGVESTSAIEFPFFNNIKHLNSYHFTDLWINGLISSILNLSETKILVFVIYPTLLTTSVYSISSFFSKRKKYTNLGLAYLIIFGSNTFLWFIDLDTANNIDYIYWQTRWYRGMYGMFFMSTKTLILIPILSIAIKYLLNKDYKKSILFLTISTLCYNTIIPAITGGIISLSIYLMFSKQNRKKIFPIILIPIISFIIIFIIISNYSLDFISNDYDFISNIYIFLLSLIKPFMIFYLLSFFIIRSVIIKKGIANIELYIFTSGIIIFSILFEILFINNPNSFQITCNIIPIILLIITAILLNDFLFSIKNKFYIFILIIIGILYF
jgi:hypothetical protein